MDISSNYAYIQKVNEVISVLDLEIKRRFIWFNMVYGLLEQCGVRITKTY